MSAMSIIILIFHLVTFVVAISLHEYAHAWLSYKLWDPTPKINNRLTPNPISHIDPVWLVTAFLLNFGRWRPVEINPSYYKDPVKDELFVALIWPLVNILLWVAWILIVMLYMLFFWYKEVALWTSMSSDLVIVFWIIFSKINFALAIFNMIPLPPLDWFRIVKMFFPGLAFYLLKYSSYIAIGFLWLFVFLPLIGIDYFQLWFISFVQWISWWLFDVFYVLFSRVFY